MRLAREVEVVIGECYNENLMPIIDLVLNAVRDNNKKLCLGIDLTLQPANDYEGWSDVPIPFANL